MVRLADLIAATRAVDGRVSGGIRASEFDCFAFDSRRLLPGELFIAVRTAKADGHDFMTDALQRGAAGVLSEREVAPALLERFGATNVTVSDVRAALEAWGAYVLRQYRPNVIGVTGSVGKTTTQHAIRAILAQGYEGNPSVFANENYNDLFGLPIALSKLSSGHQHAVLEIGCDSYGEVAKLAAMIEPRIAVVTNVTPVHTQYLGGLENLASEFGALVAALPHDGWAVLNKDDDRVVQMRQRTEAPALFYSREDPTVDYYAEDIRPGELCCRFRLCTPNGKRQVTIPLPGAHHVYTVLAASAASALAGFGLDETVAAIENLKPLPGRLMPLKGLNGSRLLDDSFSASPASTQAALAALAGCQGGRRIVVMGDMVGLGDFEVNANEEAGRRVAEVADFFVARGDKAAMAVKAARSAGMTPESAVATYSDGDVLATLSKVIAPTDTVLVKGSEEARMERVVAQLLAKPATAADVLVRQDAGWKQLVSLHGERPTWLEVDLGAIAHNVRRVKDIVGPEVEILAVLKADAYGHGAARIAQTALLHGATVLGTACLGEAVMLRERGITAPILVLGYTPPWQARDLVRHGVAASVFSLDVAKQLSRAATLQGQATAKIHVKVDTGMGRLGLTPDAVGPFVEEVQALPNLEIEGVFTHLATADAADLGYSRSQLAAFDQVLSELNRRGVHVRYKHAANSAAALAIPDARHNLVRLGIALYGLNPSVTVRCPVDFRPALAFKTQIAQLKEMPSGACISYGCTFRTKRPSTIGVIPVGYGDGFRRSPQNAGCVLVRGRRAPIVGVVCMDMCMIDLTDIPGVRQGDEVVIVGEQGGERITVEEFAANMGTINYEVISQILPRVPREVF